MRITMRYFASAREAAGVSREEREFPEGTTAGAALDAVMADFPRIGPMRGALMLMVNRDYVQPDALLRDGDELALIPPVSGGTSQRFVVQEEPIDPRAVEALVDDPGAGAVVTFIGRVRDNARGQDVTALEYEAYPEAAVGMMERIAGEVRERWGIDHVAIVHRTGTLGVGEASVVIAVASPHRAEAFAACQHVIDRLKEIVPVWKKEMYRSGATWIGSEADYQRQFGGSEKQGQFSGR